MWLLDTSRGCVSAGIVPVTIMALSLTAPTLGTVTRVTDAVVPHHLESSMRLQQLGEAWIRVMQWMPYREGLR